MGIRVRHTRKLLPPLLEVVESHTLLPAGLESTFQNIHRKAVFFLSGDIELALEGGTRFLVARGDAFITGQLVRQVYRGIHANRDAQIHALIVRFRDPHPEEQQDKTEQGPSAAFHEALEQALTGFHYLPARRLRSPLLLIPEILREMEQNTPVSAWKVSGLCQALVAELLAGGTPSSPPAASAAYSSRDDNLVVHVRHYLMEHFREPLTLTEIAWQVRLSPEHLARLFRRVTGETVFQCLDGIRIEKAKSLLLASHLPLAEIATACGYSSANLFCRHFKQRTGLTPINYRVASRADEEFTATRFRSLEPRKPTT